MKNLRHLETVLVLIVLCAASACATGRPPKPPEGGPKPDPAANPFELSPDERALAEEVAETALNERGLRTEGPLFLVAAGVERDKERELRGDLGRLAIVTFYRYDGDLTIQIWIELATREILDVQTVSHRSAPLADAELERARTLALEHASVRQHLGEDYEEILAVEPLVLRTVSEDDPLFGHRVVRLLFKTARGYLSSPIVHVDLTESRVLVETPKEQGHE